MPKFKDGWKKFKSSVSRAFQVEPEAPFEPTDRQRAIVEKLADWVVKRRLTLPAIMTLESITPLNYLGSQVLVFFYPFVTAFLNPEDYKEFQQMLEYRESISYMVNCIESKEDEWTEKKRGSRNGGSPVSDSTVRE